MVGSLFMGCDEKNGSTSPTNNCTGYMTTYAEKSANMMTENGTAAECEAAYGAMASYCSEGCESADTPEDESVCGGEPFTAEQITALCAIASGGQNIILYYGYQQFDLSCGSI